MVAGLAANTVFPSMHGNSARIVSHTMPVYEPAQCPRMNSEPTIYPNFSDSAGRASGGKQTPTGGCATSNLVRVLPCMYPGHGGFLRWGNGTKLQHLPCTMDDLSLQLLAAGTPSAVFLGESCCATCSFHSCWNSLECSMVFEPVLTQFTPVTPACFSHVHD